MRCAFLSLFLLLGCAPWNQPQNQPLAGENAPLSEGGAGEGELYIGLAFSGGGMRATAFAYGMLEELRATGGGPAGLLDEVRLVSGVSGKGVTELLREAYGMVRARKAQIAEEEAEQSGGGGWTP